jgi:biotin operon repressor
MNSTITITLTFQEIAEGLTYIVAAIWAVVSALKKGGAEV